MAVYFPRGQKSFKEIRTKFENDLSGVLNNGATGIAFVTNQEISLAERAKLKKLAGTVELDLFHLERITASLDTPSMAAIRLQFLQIDGTNASSIATLRDEMSTMQTRLEGLQTGGDSFCYLMLYHFDLQNQIAQQFAVIRKGQYPLYDVGFRIVDINSNRELLNSQLGEISAPAICNAVKWPLSSSEYYRIFVHARNGQYHQDLQLNRSEVSNCWLAATRVFGIDGSSVRLGHFDAEYESAFGSPTWKQ